MNVGTYLYFSYANKNEQNHFITGVLIRLFFPFKIHQS